MTNEPMTEKQRSFILRLLAEKDLTGTKYAGRALPALTKEQASASIDDLLDLPKKAAAAVTDGVYMCGGVVLKVKTAVHGSGRPYALALNPQTGAWEYAPGAAGRLTAADKLTADQAAEFGRIYGVCALCGRTLTDETSIARGIGPVCAGRL